MVAVGKGRRGREGEKWFTAQGIGTRKLRAGSGMSEEERKEEEEGEGCKEEEKEGLRHRSRQEAGKLELPSRRGRKRERGRVESDVGTVETLQKREAKFQEEEGSGRTMQKELGKTRT